MPGYVCTYDDYDSDYDDVASYAQIVGQMGNGRANGNSRSHGPHSAARGTHGANGNGSAREESRSEGFGAGIL